MINSVIFEDEITLYWDKQWEFPDGIVYRASCDGKVVATTKTHVSFKNLKADAEYLCSVERLNADGETVEVLYSDVVRTAKARKRIDVSKAPYFAKCDGKTLNTAALQRAIDDCKAGETVYIPKGIYLTGALDLHSDMELYIEEGGMLKGSSLVADYAPKRKTRFEGVERECYGALLNIGTLDHTAGYTSQNIVIRGGGFVSGGGFALCWAVIESERERLAEFLSENADYIKTCEKGDTIPGRARPKLVAIHNCENVILSNVTFEYGAAWNVHMIYSRNILTYGCTIGSEGVWNGDGWNPDSSENCTIFDTVFRTHDDAIAIKSGKNPEGNVIARPTRNVRVFDCRGKNGVAIGSELSGGIENVDIWDCRFVDGVAGFHLKTTRKRGGFVKNIRVRCCDLVDIRVWTGYNCNDDGEGSGMLTELENFSFENVSVTGCAYAPSDREKLRRPPILIWGFDEEEHHLKDVRLKNVVVHARDDGEIQKIEVKNITNFSIEDIDFIK